MMSNIETREWKGHSIDAEFDEYLTNSYFDDPDDVPDVYTLLDCHVVLQINECVFTGHACVDLDSNQSKELAYSKAIVDLEKNIRSIQNGYIVTDCEISIEQYKESLKQLQSQLEIEQRKQIIASSLLISI